MIDLKEGWCHYTQNLTKISVSPKNPRYCCIDDEMIVGKTNIEQSNYDCLVFCVRNIKHIKLPNFIEHICPSSFCHCNQIKYIEISNESKLQTIGKGAFFYSTIKSISIPSSVTFIGENAFDYCIQIQIIEINNINMMPEIQTCFLNCENALLMITNHKYFF